MKKYFLVMVALLLSINLFAGDNSNWDKVFVNNLKILKKETINKIEREKLKINKSILYKENLLKDIIAKQNLPEYIFRRPKEIQVFVRKDFHIINNKFIVLDKAGWKTIIVKAKQEWEY